MANITKVLVTGAAGKMGREVVKAIWAAEDLALVAAVDPSHADGADAGQVAGIGPIGVPLEGDLPAALERAKPDVAVDFTKPSAVMGNLRAILGARVRAVVGTTGLSEQDLEEIRDLCAQNGTACVVAPNFAVGAVLMMRFAELAARSLPDAEVIELHHNQKVDAPSGTAVKTAERIAAAREGAATGAAKDPTEKLTVEGARGGNVDGVPVHSVRLPGFVASQMVVFGGPGQTLTIRHDTTDRSCFMPGVLLGVRKVWGLSGLTVGLDALLGL